ncbi:MAG: glycosyltransferase [Deltaproteobacteria bacterium]|nr:glycosyltransferase [Deltaproteobacteria bacterium]
MAEAYLVKLKPRLRLLLVAHKLLGSARAGTESYCLSLGQTLADLGVEVAFLAPQGPPLQSRQEEISWQRGDLSGLPFFSFNRMNPDILASLEHPGFEAAFKNVLKHHPVDLVHFHHTYLSSISLINVAREAGLPVVLTLHDAWLLCPRLHLMTDQGRCSGPESPEKCAACLGPLALPAAPENLAAFLAKRLRLIKTLLPGCRVLAPSRFLRNLHYEYGLARGGIIHQPLGLKEIGPLFQEQTAFPPKFVFLGNIIPVKRVDLAIAALAPLAGRASLEIWGQLPFDMEKQFLESISPYPHISYCGSYQREDLPRILAGVTATLITSDFENYPLVVRESLMLKVPVIGAQTGGIPEIVEHGKNGLLFRPGDAEALRRQVERLIQRPQLAERLKHNIKPVKSMRREAEELLDLYRSLVVRGRADQSNDKAGCKKQTCTASAPLLPLPRGGCAVSEHTPSGRCSIIIPVFNNLELTRACLQSIRENTELDSYEIIVVDNGSTDGTRDFLKKNEAADLRPVLNEANLGFAKASNQGARAAQSDLLVFLNNDTLTTSRWLSELTAAAAKSNRIAAVGAKLLYPDDTVQHAGVVFNVEKKVFHIYQHFHRDHPAVNKERQFQCLTAACLLVKRDVFFEVGLFDERFVNGFEDVDLCLKIGNKGLTLLYNPRSVVVHLESKTPGRHARERENAELLAHRWLHRIIPDAEAYYAADGIIVHHIRQETGEPTAVMFDRNPNPFWEEAARLKAAGEMEAACEHYLRALRFNPYDTRKWTIGAELVDLLERLGRSQEAALHRNWLAQLLPAVSQTKTLRRKIIKFSKQGLENGDNFLAGDGP